MYTNKANTLFRATAILGLVATLAACGGGGGGSADTGGGGQDDGSSAGPTPAPASLQPLLPSSYAVGSPQEYMFNQLNDARMKCGFGALRHDTRLDQSAQNHANWIARNNYEFTHTEVEGTPGFTGTTSRQRMIFTGYNAYAEQEFINSTVSKYHATEGLSSSQLEQTDSHKIHIPLQLSMVYHSIGALRPYRDIGFGSAKRSSYGFASGTVIGHNVGSENASQKLAGDAVATYPCEGVQGLWTFHGNEIPNPIAGRDLVANPPGHPVMVLSRWGTKLTDMQITMQHAGTGANVEMAAVRTMDNDSSGLMLRNEAFAIPATQLEKNASYRVSVRGKIDGAAFERNFTFSTGSVDAASVATGRYE